MNKSIFSRLKRLEDSSVGDGVTILAPTADGRWTLRGGLCGTFPDMAAAEAFVEKKGAKGPLIIIDI